MDTQDNGAEAAAMEEQQPASPRAGEQEQEGSEGGEGGDDGGDDDGGGEEDQWATGGWLDEETGAGWGEEGGVQGGADADAEEAAPMEEGGSNAAGEDKSTTAAESAPSHEAGAAGGGGRGGRAGAGGHRGGGAAGSSSSSSGSGFASGRGEGGRGGGREGSSSGSRRGGLSVGSMRGGFTSGGRGGRDRDSGGGGGRRGDRGEGGRGGGRGGGGGGGYGSRGGGGPSPSSRQDYDRRYGPGPSDRGGPPGGWEQQGPRRLPPPMTLPPPTHLSLAPPMPYDHRGGPPPPAAGGGGYYPPGAGGDQRYNGQQAPGMPPLPPGPYPGAPPPGQHYPPGLPPPYGAPPPYQQQQQQQQQVPPHMYHQQQALPHHPLHRGGAIALPPTSAAGMPAIQSFQKFMLEQTDEPSAEESLQRYAEYKFKYVEDYSKMVFEEKKSEEWFADRYLPTARLEKSVEAKREWAKQEAGRFSRQLLQRPDLFVVSASLDPSTELEYHALVKKYAKSAASASSSSASTTETSGEKKKEKKEEEGKEEASGVNGAAEEEEDMSETPAAAAAGAGEAGSVVGGLDAKSLEGHAEATLCLRPFPSTVPRAPLEALLRERGGSFLRFLLSDPAKDTYCNTRSAWLVYASKEEAEAARQALHNTEAEHPMEEQVRGGGGQQQQPAPHDYFRPFTLQLFAHNGKKTVPLPAELSDPRHLEKDATQALAQALALDKEKGLDAEKEGLQAILDAPGVKAELGRRNLSFQLDLVMAYLRRVHFVVFYGGDEFKDEGDLLFSAPQLYKRIEPYKPAEKADKAPTEEGGEKTEPKWSEWTKRMDEKVAKLLETLGKGSRVEGLDEAVQAQKELEEKAKEKWLLESMNNEDEGRWRCAAQGCTKLFKTSEFLQKHLLLKHIEGLENSLRLIRLGLIRTAFEADQEKPLPPVQVDKGSNVLKAVPVGGVLAEVAAVLGKDMSRWRQLIEESTRRRARGREGGGGGGGGMPRGRVGGHYGPRPVIGVGGGALVAAGGGGVVGMDIGPPRVGKNYKDIDVPKSNLVTVDYGDVAIPPPPKRKRKRQADKGGPATTDAEASGAGAE